MVSATDTPTPPPTRAVIRILPSSRAVDCGSTFSMDVRVEAGGQPVDSARACVDFDPNHLTIVEIHDGDVLSSVSETEYDNEIGELSYTASSPGGGGETGSFVLCTIEFYASQSTPGTGLAFHTTNPRRTEVSLGGVSKLGYHTNSTIAVEGALERCFRGSVYERLGESDWQPLSNVRVDLYGCDQQHNLGSWLAWCMTDKSGSFELSTLSPFNYYNIVETDPDGYVSVGVQPGPGACSGGSNDNWIQYDGAGGGIHEGNRFYDLPETMQTTPTPTVTSTETPTMTPTNTVVLTQTPAAARAILLLPLIRRG